MTHSTARSIVSADTKRKLKQLRKLIKMHVEFSKPMTMTERRLNWVAYHMIEIVVVACVAFAAWSAWFWA